MKLPALVVHAATLQNLGGPNSDVATIQSLTTLFTNVIGVIVALAGLHYLLCLW